MDVGDDVVMGAWYGFKPLYRPEHLEGVSRATVVEALRAEGVDVRAPSGGCLSTMPLYAESRLARTLDGLHAFDGRGGLGHRDRVESYPNAAFVEARALSFPTFWQPESDLPLVDEYVEAMKKVERFADELRDCERRNRIV